MCHELHALWDCKPRLTIMGYIPFEGHTEILCQYLHHWATFHFSLHLLIIFVSLANSHTNHFKCSTCEAHEGLVSSLTSICTDDVMSRPKLFTFCDVNVRTDESINIHGANEGVETVECIK